MRTTRSMFLVLMVDAVMANTSVVSIFTSQGQMCSVVYVPRTTDLMMPTVTFSSMVSPTVDSSTSTPIISSTSSTETSNLSLVSSTSTSSSAAPTSTDATSAPSSDPTSTSTSSSTSLTSISTTSSPTDTSTTTILADTTSSSLPSSTTTSASSTTSNTCLPLLPTGQVPDGNFEDGFAPTWRLFQSAGTSTAMVVPAAIEGCQSLEVKITSDSAVNYRQAAISQTIQLPSTGTQSLSMYIGRHNNTPVMQAPTVFVVFGSQTLVYATACGTASSPCPIQGSNGSVWQHVSISADVTVSQGVLQVYFTWPNPYGERAPLLLDGLAFGTF